MLLSFIMIKFLVILVLRFVRILIINMLFWIWLKLVFEMMYMYYYILCDWFVNIFKYFVFLCIKIYELMFKG